MEMNYNEIIKKLQDLLEVEVAVVEMQAIKNPAMNDNLAELLEVQQFVSGVKEVPLIYA